jgi:hypothetical protein
LRIEQVNLLNIDILIYVTSDMQSIMFLVPIWTIALSSLIINQLHAQGPDTAQLDRYGRELDKASLAMDSFNLFQKSCNAILDGNDLSMVPVCADILADWNKHMEQWKTDNQWKINSIVK